MLQVFYELTPDVFVEMQTVRYKSWRVGQACSAADAFVGALPFDDPGGTLTIKGWRKWRVVETTASPTLLASGRIRTKTVKRGDSERSSLRLGADRWWDCDAYDNNTLVGSRLIRGTEANRPAETAGERLAWLLDSPFTVLHDEGHVTYPSDPLDPADYTLQTAADVIADCAQPGGYNFFAMQTDTTDATDTPELFFMLPTDSDWASSVSISDDPADYDGVTVFAPSYDAELGIGDELIASGVAVPYDGGDSSAYVYVSDDAIGDEFAYVNKTAPMANVKTAAKALVIAERHLDLSRTESEKITCTIHVPAALANAVRPWHRVPYKSTWMPGFAVYRDCRVVNWSIEQQPFSGGGDGYLVHLELSPVTESSASGAIVQANSTQEQNLPLEEMPTAGNLLVMGLFVHDTGGPATINTPSGWTAATAQFTNGQGGFEAAMAAYGARVFYKVSNGTEQIIPNPLFGEAGSEITVAEIIASSTLLDADTGWHPHPGGGIQVHPQGNLASAGYSAMDVGDGLSVVFVGFWVLLTELSFDEPDAVLDQSEGEILTGDSNTVMVAMIVNNTSGGYRLTGTQQGLDNFPVWAMLAFEA
jgi:hypothetical protein